MMRKSKRAASIYFRMYLEKTDDMLEVDGEIVGTRMVAGSVFERVKRAA